MAVFPEAVGQGDAESHPHIAPPVINGSYRHPAGDGAHRLVLIYLVFKVYGAGLTDTVRHVSYGDIALESAAVTDFGADGEWLECFAIPEALPGQKVSWAVSGMLLSPKWVRINSVSYTGCDDDAPTFVTAHGNGTTLTGTALTAPSAGKAVQAFGSRTGLSGFSDNQLYANNTGMSLMIGDADGTGSPDTLTASRAVTGKWGSIGCIITPADVVGTPKPIRSRSRITVSGRRLPRPGVVPRRHVLDVKPEA